MLRTAQAYRTDPLRQPVHQSRASEATDPSPPCGAPTHRSSGTRRPMGTPHPTYLPRTIASHRVDGAEPCGSSARAYISPLRCASGRTAHGWRAPVRPSHGGGFDGISGSEAAETPTPLELGEPPDQNLSATDARTRAHREHKLNLAHFGAVFRVWCRAKARNGPLSAAEIVSQPVPTF